jgi:hypothetical protein
MSMGIKTYNSQGNLTIDENFAGYAYLGKYRIPDISPADVTFQCQGFPLVFFSLPYNVPDGTGQTGGLTTDSKIGVAMIMLKDNGNGTWTATFISNTGYSGNSLNLYMRVFGRVKDNWPSGATDAYGLRVSNASGQCVFDSNLRMLKLAANTYDTEITLIGDTPGYDDPNNKYDSSITLPIDLNNKSISATTRGTMYMPYNDYGYPDWDGSNQWIDHYTVMAYNTLYAASNNSLQIKRCSYYYNSFEVMGVFFVAYSPMTVYSRLAVIDNTQFP